MPYLVRSLSNLREQIDRAWPYRDRRTDGWLRWPANGKSYGHNPDGKGAVHAIDIDKDGINPQWIVDHIYRGGGVLWYVIWNRQLWSNDYGWKPYAYHGLSPHTDHMHIEVRHTAAGENFTGDWRMPGAPGESMGSAPYPGDAYGDADPVVPMASTAGGISAGGTQAKATAHAVALLRNY